MVNTKHSLYEKHLPSWQFMRTFIEGDEAIKASGEAYIPRLSGQTNAEYLAYIGRPFYENYSQRTLDGLTGLLFSKAPTVEYPKVMQPIIDNINLAGQSFTDLAQQVSDEVLMTGRIGLLVDMPSVPNTRPYTTKYPTESIINWKYIKVNGANVLSMVVLEESETVWKDQFDSEEEIFYRVLALDEGELELATTGTYYQAIYKGNIKDGYLMQDDPIIPLMNGKPMQSIPFVGITPDMLTIEPRKAPLIDLAKVNLSHFKLNVEYYHGMHFTALPTPYGSGVQTQDGEIFKIGSSEIYMFSDPQASMSFLEFEGKGLETLENEKSKLINSMIVLGSNMLQGDKNVAEAENTVAMRSAGQNATLITIADTVGRGLTKVLEILRDWSMASGEVSAVLNKDYNATIMSPQLLKELVTGKQTGDITPAILFHNMKKGELVPEDMTLEQYLTDLEEAAPDMTVSPINNTDNSRTTMQAIRDKIGL